MDRTYHMYRKATDPPVRLQPSLMYWEQEPKRFWLEGNGDLLSEVNDWLLERQNYSMEAIRSSALAQALFVKRALFVERAALRRFDICDETQRVEFILRFSDIG